MVVIGYNGERILSVWIIFRRVRMGKGNSGGKGGDWDNERVLG